MLPFVVTMLAALPLAAAPADESFGVSASLEAELLEAGGEYELVLEVEQEGEIHLEYPWKTPRTEGQIRRPILQIEHHPAVQFHGAPPDEPRTQADFQEVYFRKPYGRRVMAKTTAIPFTLTRAPEPGDTVSLNVVQYFEGDDARIVRRRIELPLEPGARAEGVRSRRSDWGHGETLAIGETAPPFALRSIEGEVVTLEELLGDQRALILAYRRST